MMDQQCYRSAAPVTSAVAGTTGAQNFSVHMAERCTECWEVDRGHPELVGASRGVILVGECAIGTACSAHDTVHTLEFTLCTWLGEVVIGKLSEAATSTSTWDEAVALSTKPSRACDQHRT